MEIIKNIKDVKHNNKKYYDEIYDKFKKIENDKNTIEENLNEIKKLTIITTNKRTTIFKILIFLTNILGYPALLTFFLSVGQKFDSVETWMYIIPFFIFFIGHIILFSTDMLIINGEEVELTSKIRKHHLKRYKKEKNKIIKENEQNENIQ